MFKYLTIAAFICFTGSLLADEGADLFVSMKCVKCHTVDSQNIATTSDKDPSEIKDLSKAGTDFDAASLKSFLLKESDLKGEKHKVKVKGEEADLQKIVEWVLTLK